MNKKPEENKVYRMAKVHNFVEMGQGSQQQCAMQKKSCPPKKQMATVEYISDTEEIVKWPWLAFHQNGAPAFNWSERSPLPPA